MLNKENIWSESSLPGQLCPITKFHGKPGCQRSQANGSCVAAGLITWGTWREGQGHSHSFGRIWRRFTPNLTSPRAKEHSRVLANQSSTCLSTPVFVLSCKAPPASRMKSMLCIRLLQASRPGHHLPAGVISRVTSAFALLASQRSPQQRILPRFQDLAPV